VNQDTAPASRSFSTQSVDSGHYPECLVFGAGR
jgi:hypothetical protein